MRERRQERKLTLPDEITFGGARALHGSIRLPGDKSISHRALLFSAVAAGESSISNLATGDDVKATCAALAALGVDIVVDAHAVAVTGAGTSSPIMAISLVTAAVVPSGSRICCKIPAAGLGTSALTLSV